MTLPSPLPPGLSVRDAAVYANCKTVSAFRDWVRKGIMPEDAAVQHGCDVDTLRKAPTRNSDGLASGPLARALDLLSVEGG
jgi:hypothetical protein